jgi:tripeptide aminopeptidase
MDPEPLKPPAVVSRTGSGAYSPTMRALPELLGRPYAAELVERLIRYAKIETTSDHHVETIPSTPTQWDLARLLVEELKGLGIEEVGLDEHCYLIARVPAAKGFERAPTIGLMAHIDTSSDVSGKDVRPRVIKNYDGSVIELGHGYVLDPAEDNPDLAAKCGDTIIVADGSTLLGGDDKAGVAEIMTALRWLLGHPEQPRGSLEIIFTPDEETGKGMSLFPVSKLKSTACYTFDGSRSGEIEAECFNARTVKVRIKGRSIHIGAARGKLANAVSMASAFVSMLPRSEAPESTDGWFGYYCAHEMQATLDSAFVEVFLRDFTKEGMERRVEAVRAIAKAVEAQFPLGSIELEVLKSYENMRERLDQRPEVLERAMEAARAVGADPFIKPIRGGTDGARLTERGIPTPNVFTGSYNYHSRFEWVSVADMALATDLMIELVGLWAKS